MKKELGYCADPSQRINTNITNYILATEANQYFASPTNMSFHNLTTTAILPSGTANLLGLNLKFCLEEPTPKQQIEQMKKDYDRFSKCFRLHFVHNKDKPITPTEAEYFFRQLNDSISYLPKLYIRSEGTIRPSTNTNKAILELFHKHLALLSTIKFKNKHLNLTIMQKITLS